MDKKVIKIARRFSDKVTASMPVKMVVLFGSQAQGTATASSDIDVAVVVEHIQGDYLQMSADLFGLVRQVNTRIEPVLLCADNDRGGFLESVLKQGKVIYREIDN